MNDTTQNCVENALSALDCISRQAVLYILEREGHKWGNDYRDWVDAVNEVETLPSINPQEPKRGHWEQYGYPWEDRFKCSECGEKQPKILCGERIIEYWSDYCPNCGAKMFESQESEA